MSKNVDRHTLHPETIGDLQKALYDWQVYNFGVQDPELCLLGIAEEVGELSHAQLKLEQGIRGTPSEHNAKMRDAIGDISVYLLNFLSGTGRSASIFDTNCDADDLEYKNNKLGIRKAVLKTSICKGRLLESPSSQECARNLVRSLKALCVLKSIDLPDEQDETVTVGGQVYVYWSVEAILRETWAEIGRRDWRLHPRTGLPPVS
jgi:hypothetical protein